MADRTGRTYARIRLSIADDEDLEDLSPLAQWLYFRVLVAHPELEMCGVVDWRPRRLLGKARGVTLAMILDAAKELEDGYFVLFDPETEEALVRSLIRSDEMLRNPKGAVGCVRSYRGITSKTLRAAVVTEIQRERAEHPEWTCWASPISKDELTPLLARQGLQRSDYMKRIPSQIADLLGGPIEPDSPPDPPAESEPDQEQQYQSEYQSDWEPERESEAQSDHQLDHHSGSQPDTQPEWEPDPIQHSTTNTQQSAKRGYVSPEGYVGDDSRTDPPTTSRCLKHPHGTSEPCGSCAEARKAHAKTQADYAAAARASRRAETRRLADAKLQAIADCQLCDEDGYAGSRLCDHVDRSAAASRGSAAVRAILAKKRAPDGGDTA